MIEKRIDTDLYAIEFKKPEAVDAVMIGTVGLIDGQGTAFSHAVYGTGNDLLDIAGNSIKQLVKSMLKGGVNPNTVVAKIAELGAKATNDGIMEHLGKPDNIIVQFDKEFVPETEGSEMN